MMPQQPQAAPKGGFPSVNDPTGPGGGNIGLGNVPVPGAPGFTGEGGGDNRGQQQSV